MSLKKKFIAVIGRRKAGKSTVIQSLTGCKNGAFRGRVEVTAVLSLD
jgi:ABC-type phosphate/phosphonate transport system ATPase subunit